MRYLVAIVLASVMATVAYAAHLVNTVEAFSAVAGVMLGTPLLLFLFMRVTRVDIGLIGGGASLIVVLVSMRAFETLSLATIILAAINLTAALVARFVPTSFLTELKNAKVRSRAGYMDDLDGDWPKPFEKEE